MTLEGWTVVREQIDRFDAENIKAFLGANGIAAEVHSDDAGGTIPSLEETQGVQVVVRTEDAERARELLVAQERASSAGSGAGDGGPDGGDGGGDGG